MWSSSFSLAALYFSTGTNAIRHSDYGNYQAMYSAAVNGSCHSQLPDYSTISRTLKNHVRMYCYPRVYELILDKKRTEVELYPLLRSKVKLGAVFPSSWAPHDIRNEWFFHNIYQPASNSLQKQSFENSPAITNREMLLTKSDQVWIYNGDCPERIKIGDTVAIQISSMLEVGEDSDSSDQIENQTTTIEGTAVEVVLGKENELIRFLLLRAGDVALRIEEMAESQ